MFGSRKPPPNELPIPPEARSDEESRELIRAWAAHKGLHCSFRENTWGDNERAAWGILLTDVVRRSADALHEQRGADQSRDHTRNPARIRRAAGRPDGRSGGGH